MIFENNIEFVDYVQSLTNDDSWDVIEDDMETIRLIHPDYGQFDIVLSMDATFVLHKVGDNDIKVFYYAEWDDDSIELSVLKAVKKVVLL